jgi:uncharacterized protein (TIGR00730 family)
MHLQSLAVFCGSKAGKDPAFVQQAEQLGEMLAHKNCKLIYGGGNKGIMGAVANACLHAKGYVVGIIPKLLMDWEHGHQGLTEMHVVEDMHTRKKMLYELSDAAVVLPGGYGTLDELFEIITWNQLSIHNKKIFIINSNGFYDHLIGHLHKMQEQDFLYDPIEERMVILKNVAEMESYLSV